MRWSRPASSDPQSQVQCHRLSRHGSRSARSVTSSRPGAAQRCRAARRSPHRSEPAAIRCGHVRHTLRDHRPCSGAWVVSIVLVAGLLDDDSTTALLLGLVIDARHRRRTYWFGGQLALRSATPRSSRKPFAGVLRRSSAPDRAGRPADAAGGHFTGGAAQRVRHGPQPRARRGLRDGRPAAAMPRRARGRDGSRTHAREAPRHPASARWPRPSPRPLVHRRRCAVVGDVRRRSRRRRPDPIVLLAASILAPLAAGYSDDHLRSREPSHRARRELPPHRAAPRETLRRIDSMRPPGPDGGVDPSQASMWVHDPLAEAHHPSGASTWPASFSTHPRRRIASPASWR